MFKLAEAVVEFKTAGLATVTGGVRSLLGVFGDLTSTLLKASGVAAGLGSAFGAVSALKLAAQAEQAQVAMEVLVGSADKARTLLDALYARAGRTPFEIEGLTKATQTMLGFGIAAEEVLPDLDMLSEVAMGNKDRLQSLALAFGQV